MSTDTDNSNRPAPPLEALVGRCRKCGADQQEHTLEIQAQGYQTQTLRLFLG